MVEYSLKDLDNDVHTAEIYLLIDRVEQLLDERSTNQEIVQRVRTFIYGSSIPEEMEIGEGLDILKMGLIPYIDSKIPEHEREKLKERIKGLESKCKALLK